MSRYRDDGDEEISGDDGDDGVGQDIGDYEDGGDEDGYRISTVDGAEE